jgi:thymidine kinase
MKTNKSLCKSCSNRVVIKFHGKNIRNDQFEDECFYNFKVMISDKKYALNTNGAEYYETHVSNVIVDECSFYNKSLNRLNNKIKEDQTNDDSDSNSENNDNGSGVTFVNIPGALLP